MKHIGIFLLLVFGQLSAQVEFKAKASDNIIQINGTTRVEFVANVTLDSIHMPSFDGFEIVNGPNLSESVNIASGKKEIKMTRSYLLAPKSEGKKSIDLAVGYYKGTKYVTKPVEIEVRPIPTDERKHNSIFVLSEYSANTIGLKDTLTVKNWIYRGNSIGVFDIKTQMMNYPGFTKVFSEKGEQKKFEEEDIDGVTFKKFLFQVVKLVPMRKGTFSLDGYVVPVVATIAAPGAAANLGKPTFRRNMEITGNPIVITVTD